MNDFYVWGGRFIYAETQKTEGTQGHVATNTKVRVTQLQAEESNGLLATSRS